MADDDSSKPRTDFVARMLSQAEEKAKKAKPQSRTENVDEEEVDAYVKNILKGKKADYP